MDFFSNYLLWQNTHNLKFAILIIFKCTLSEHQGIPSVSFYFVCVEVLLLDAYMLMLLSS